MNTVTIHITEAQSEVFHHLIVRSPWFRNKAKACTYATRSNRLGAEITFDLEHDLDQLLDMLAVADRFGHPYRTCRALEKRVATAAEHARAVRRDAA